MARTRILVVDDSLTVRKRIVEAFTAASDFEVVGEAGDGKAAIELCQALRPDVVTLDMMLPLLTGLAATEYIMAYCPTPILIVSASTNRGELYRTYDALAAGAVDVLEKAVGDEPEDGWEQKLLDATRMVSRIKVITHLRGKVEPRATPVALGTAPDPRPGSGGIRAVAVGASTGGPSALCAVLGALPAEYPYPILVVIHLGKSFATAFADWLDGQLPRRRVTFARDGERLPAVGEGQVFMAPPDRHLLLRQGHLYLSDAPERHSCRPSVDVLFESVARELGPSGAACLLTGMGRDGAEGLLAVRRAGGTTLAQDEASCVVYGMPREAALLGAAERILPLSEMGGALAALGRTAGARR